MALTNTKANGFETLIEQVIAKGKIGGRHSPYKAIIAFLDFQR